MMSDNSPLPCRRRHVAVIVLGDVGRSPRMQYHARSLLERGYFVSLVGYEGEDLIPDLNPDSKKWAINDSEERLLHILRFKPCSPPIWLKKYKFFGKLPVGLPIYLFLRLFGLIFGLVYVLWFRLNKVNNRTVPIDCILVQNPPSIPLLLLSYLYCITHTTRISSGQGRKESTRPGFVIDWHNLGYTMFDTSPNHPIKKFAKYYEMKLATLSSGNLCVTSEMKEYLTSKFRIKNDNITVLHDRPPEFFKSTSLEEKHILMMKLRDEMELACPELKEMRLNDADEEDEVTIFTKRKTLSNGRSEIVAKENQPVLLISSTSWTPDEDFSILLNALVELNEKLNNDTSTKSTSFPHVVVIVTGKGPLKSMYQSQISKLNLNYFSIITMWLEAKDYPILLGCCDLGVSLHVSTSGFDLPMKIYDFFGCTVPVCAVSFKCLDELVQDGFNGRIFRSSSELSSQIYDLFNGKKRDNVDNKFDGMLKSFRNNIREISRWRENWNDNAHEMVLASFPKTDSTKLKLE